MRIQKLHVMQIQSIPNKDSKVKSSRKILNEKISRRTGYDGTQRMHNTTLQLNYNNGTQEIADGKKLKKLI